MEDDFLVTIHDLRKLGYCVSGVRRWAKNNDIDFKDFLGDGVPASILETKDGLAKFAIQRLRVRRSADGR